MARAKRIPDRQIKLTLLKDLNTLFSYKNTMTSLPLYISDNMHHQLRDYQQTALFNLDEVMHMRSELNQLMFYMATGSGKTDLMAAAILYLYKEWGYQCFLFTTKSIAVVNKTWDNLTNSESAKYLFHSPIYIDGLNISIKAVEDFPSELEEGTIYIKLTGIQQLSNDFYSPRENGVTFDIMAKHKTVILADEAHHFNVGTMSKKEDSENRSWERLLDQIRDLNPKNLQLEFTATIDLHNPDIYEKYRNKIIAQYDLKQFVDDGYSKEVFRLQANNSDEDKMMNAVLLSQYRKHVAHSLGIDDFKPVILFKSNTIKVSKETTEKFLSMMSDLTAESLESFIRSQVRTNRSEALGIAYDYWLKQDFGATVSELQNDFNKETTINANDSDSKEVLNDISIAQKLNTLESPENLARAVFAVAKLSEGWDVLNLYDIVRIGEKAITPKDTNAEAQLIGRGARYYPFKYKGHRSFIRRFDDTKPSYEMLERLYYHTINNPQYLENLRKSLDSIHLPINDDTKYTTYTANLKPSFKRTDAYKYGNLYYNEVKTVPDDWYDGITKYGLDPETTDAVNMIDSTVEKNIDAVVDLHEEKRAPLVAVAGFSNPKDKRLIQAAISRNKFFRFNNLKKVCPTLTSIRELLTSDKWLGRAFVWARVAVGNEELTNDQKLEAVSRYLERVHMVLVNNFQRAHGTNKFKPLALRDVLPDTYIKRVAGPGNKTAQQQHIAADKMTGPNNEWFVYDYSIVNDLEQRFVNTIGGEIPNFKKKYKNVYLLRIDERNTTFRLHDFDTKTYHYNGYIPDFILYLEGADFIYQVYMEPKGMQLLQKDEWKEKLLESINPDNITIVDGGDGTKLYGVKFYTEDSSTGEVDIHKMFPELREKGILPEPDEFKLK